MPALPARTVLFACALLLPGVPALPAIAGDKAVEYRLDPVHTRVMFAIDHAGFSKAIGTVSGSTGTLVFDPDDWARARIEVSVPVACIDLGDAEWNKAVLARTLLDAEGHPEARFVSTHVEPVDATHAIVHGTLTLRGVSRDVALDVTLNARKRHPLPPFRRTVGFSARTLLSRADFGITAWKSVIGDEVELRIETEATRIGKADDDTGIDEVPAPPPSPTRPETTP